MSESAQQGQVPGTQRHRTHEAITESLRDDGRYSSYGSSTYAGGPDPRTTSQTPSGYTSLSNEPATQGSDAIPSPTSNNYVLSNAGLTGSQHLSMGASAPQDSFRNDGHGVIKYPSSNTNTSEQSALAVQMHPSPVTSTKSGANVAKISHLSSLGDQFLVLKYRDYIACQKFISAHAEILHEDPQKFLLEALKAQTEGKASRARLCIQQSLILRKCSDFSEKQRRAFLGGLADKDKKITRGFLEDFDTTLKYIMDTAKAQADKAYTEQHTGISREGNPANWNEKGRNTTTATFFPMARHTTDSYRPNNDGDDLPTAVEGLNIIGESEQGQVDYQGSPRYAMKPPPVVHRRESGSTRRSTLSSVDEDAHPDFGPQTLVPSIVPDIRGTQEDEELLDGEYYKRPDAKTFFAVGRVFALLWHESAGDGKPRPGVHLSNAKFVRTGPLGQKVFSHIRRMVVVKNRHGYCICRPINTYNGQGVSKPGLSKEEREAHSIVYSAASSPMCTAAERRFITKKAIAVDIARPDRKLDQMSRLNFAKVHTVEWNVKVMNVGKVSQESMVYLNTYSQAEFNSP